MTKEKALERLLSLCDRDPLTGCLLFRGLLDGDGYARFRYGAHDLGHKAAWVLAGNERQKGRVLSHSCDRRNCCNAEHLALDTQRGNVRAAQARGRLARGRRSQTRITAQNVLDIRRLVRSGEKTIAELVPVYGVLRQAIRHIADGRSYGWVTSPDQRLHGGVLDAAGVYEMRVDYYRFGLTQAECAVKYGVPAPTARLAIIGTTWAWVEFPPECDGLTPTETPFLSMLKGSPEKLVGPGGAA